MSQSYYDSQGSWVRDIPTRVGFHSEGLFECFSGRLSKIPPERKMDFNIDLITDEKPISIRPYRMASVELKELKAQFQKFLDKGFIKPSIFSMGCLDFICEE